MNKEELLELIKEVIIEDIESSKKEGLEIYLTNGTVLKLFQYTQSYLYHNKKNEDIDKINKILLDEINFASEHYASLELGRTDMYNILDIVNKALGSDKE